MKKKTCIVLIFVLGSFFTNAQDSTTTVKKHRHEIGMNATVLLKSAVSMYYNNSDYIDLGNSYANTYLIAYNNYFEKFALRFGYGQNIFGSLSDKNTQGTNKSSNEQTSKNATFYFRAGLQKNYDINKSWNWYYGFDLAGSYQYMYSKTDNTAADSLYYPASKSESRTDALSYGGGPLLGVKFKFNERVCLSTETSLYFSYNTSIEDTKTTPLYRYSPYANNTSHTETSGFKFKVNIPVIIFLNIKF